MALSAGRSRIASFVNRRFLTAVGLCLVAAAALKGHQFIDSGVPATSAIRSVSFYLALVTMEFLLGAWLINGLHRRASRIIAALCFFVFWDIALWMALTGRPSCGCLGDLKVNPWWAVGFDSAVLLGLMLLCADGPERTIRSHPLQFCRFLVLASSLAIPGVVTMACFARENLGRHDLRHDPAVNDMKLVVKERLPTGAALMARVAREADTDLTVDADLKESFLACKPNWRQHQDKPRRCSIIMEVIASGMPVRSRWVKTWDGYVLVRDDPWRRSRNYWIGGLVFGIVGSALLVWGSRHRPVSYPSLPVGDVVPVNS